MYTLPAAGGSGIVFWIIGAVSAVSGLVYRRFQRS